MFILYRESNFVFWTLRHHLHSSSIRLCSLLDAAVQCVSAVCSPLLTLCVLPRSEENCRYHSPFPTLLLHCHSFNLNIKNKQLCQFAYFGKAKPANKPFTVYVMFKFKQLDAETEQKDHLKSENQIYNSILQNTPNKSFSLEQPIKMQKTVSDIPQKEHSSSCKGFNRAVY